MDTLREAIARMSQSVEARRKNNLRLKADFLISRGWGAVPFKPKNAPEGVVAHPSHPYQKWAKLGMLLVTEQACKKELKDDTDEVIRLGLMS